MRVSTVSSATATGLAPTAATAASGQKLESLQALRGLAALLVALLHATQMTGVYAGLPDLFKIATNGIMSVGYFGVDIFFVLSGVVISILVRRNAERPEAPGSFLLRRAAKLLPTFWVSLAVLMVLPPSPDADVSLGSLLSRPLSLILLDSQSAHPVGWTLIYEAHFYIIAAVALCFGSRAGTVLLAWIPLQVAAVALSSMGMLPEAVFLKPISLELCGGLLGGTLAPRFPMRAAGGVMVGVLAGMVAAAALLPVYELSDHGTTRVLVLGLPAAVLVYAAMSLEMSGWKPPRVALWLGEISYSLYMWHIPVLLIAAVLMLGVLHSVPGAAAYWAAGVAGSIVVAAVAYRWIEAPVVAWANRLTRGKPRAVHAAS